MGNCAPRAPEDLDDATIKVVTCSGGVMELHPPLTAACITNGFSNHGLFRSAVTHPLPHNEDLISGELYYLRPLIHAAATLPPLSSAAQYRMMSVDGDGPCKGGAWRVKLVIRREELAEILAQEARVSELVESVRAVAKCGTGAASAAGSDQWSLASSRRGWMG